MSADVQKVEANGWDRPLAALALEPSNVRNTLREHLDFNFEPASVDDPKRQAAEIIDTDRKGVAARLNGWRSFWPGRNVTWAEVVNKLINAFGEPAQVDRPIEHRERRLQQLFESRGLPRGEVVFSTGVDADFSPQGEPLPHKSGLNLLRFARQNAQSLASLYTANAGPAVNCVQAILGMLHPVNEESPILR